MSNIQNALDAINAVGAELAAVTADRDSLSVQVATLTAKEKPSNVTTFYGQVTVQ